jgi:ankyrin repeat protein
MSDINLFQAIRMGEIDIVLENLSHGNVAATNKDGENLLHEAVAHDQLQIGRILLQKRISVNHQERKGLTPLHYAASYNNLPFATVLIQNGADPNILDEHDNSTLWTAVFSAAGNYEIVELLTRSGAVATRKNKHGRSPLDLAREIGDRKLSAILSRSVK